MGWERELGPQQEQWGGTGAHSKDSDHEFGVVECQG